MSFSARQFVRRHLRYSLLKSDGTTKRERAEASVCGVFQTQATVQRNNKMELHMA